MAEIETYNTIRRTKDGAIFGLNIRNDLFSLRKPRIILTITNPPSDRMDGKNRYAWMNFGVDEMLTFMRKLQEGMEEITLETEGKEIWEFRKGGEDRKRRYGADVLSRSFTMTADKGRILLKIEIFEGRQLFAKNRWGKSLPGIVEPIGKTPLESVYYDLDEGTAENLAYVLDKEYAAWRCALNQDLFAHPEKYTYYGLEEKRM